MKEAENLAVARRKARYGELVQTLCAIVVELLDAELERQTCDQCTRATIKVDQESSNFVDEELTLPMIAAEFGLTPRQVLLLRRRGGFPAPHRRQGTLVFWRSEVEEWIGNQPNPARPADVLRREKGSPIRRVGSRQASAIIPLKATNYGAFG